VAPEFTWGAHRPRTACRWGLVAVARRAPGEPEGPAGTVHCWCAAAAEQQYMVDVLVLCTELCAVLHTVLHTVLFLVLLYVLLYALWCVQLANVEAVGGGPGSVLGHDGAGVLWRKEWDRAKGIVRHNFDVERGPSTSRCCAAASFLIVCASVRGEPRLAALACPVERLPRLALLSALPYAVTNSVFFLGGVDSAGFESESASSFHACALQWFPGTQTNVCYNALDRHVMAGRGSQACIFWEGNDPGSDCTLTYTERPQPSVPGTVLYYTLSYRKNNLL